MRTAVLLGAGLLGLTLAVQAQDDAAKKDLAALQGSWKRVSAVVEGKKVGDAVLKNTTLIIEGDRYTLRTGDEKRTGMLKLDASQAPRQLTLTPDSGPNKGKSLLGIYELDGDNWRYCLGAPEQKRPAAFSSETGSNQGLYVNKRVVPEKE